MSEASTGAVMTGARQAIEDLRRRYAQAVDAVSRGGVSARQAVEREFGDIFAPEAVIRFMVGGVPALHAVGPEAWATVVCQSLAKYRGTQHLIGTQVVHFGPVTFAPDGRLIVGEAAMVSHVQASHWTDDRLRVVIGDYRDDVRFDGSAGWRIHAMDLIQHCRWERSLTTA